MKTFILLFSLVFSLISLSAASTTISSTDNVIVVISPHQDSKVIQTQFMALTSAFYKMKHGDTLTVLNGEDMSTLAALKNPEQEAFISAKSRKNANRKAISAFNKNIKKLTSKKRTGSINLPRVLDEIARYHTHQQKSGNRKFLLIGSPIFDAHPAYDMRGQRIPSNSHILASSEQSIFGTKTKEEQLDKLGFHWWLTQPLTPYTYAQKLQNFYHLYLHHQGAGLMSFTHDKDTIFRLFLSDAAPLTPPKKISDSTLKSNKLEMLVVRDYQAVYQLYEGAVSTELPSKHAWQSPQLLKVGIQWQAIQGNSTTIDLDIYTQTPSGKVLFFGRTSTAQGSFYKVERTGSTIDNTQYETIEFHQPIDVSTLVIGINVYHANTEINTKKNTKASTNISAKDNTEMGDIRGVLRLQLANNLYAKPFQFKGSTGDLGNDITTVLKEKGGNTLYSKRFSVMDIVGLTKKDNTTTLATVEEAQ